MYNRKCSSSGSTLITYFTYRTFFYFGRFSKFSSLPPIRKILLNIQLFFLVLFSLSIAQVDNFSKEEADYFRAKKIYPLVAHEQDGDYPRSTYLIPHDIIVPKGKVLTLYPGSTLLFKKDTRLIVKGKIIAKGKSFNPVLFCKLDNGDYYTPVDSMVDTKWDGIFITDSGKVELQYTHITDSKYGLVVEEPLGEITLDSVQFYYNRYQNLKIGNEDIAVTEFVPIFYQLNSFSKSKLTTDISGSIASSYKEELVKEPPKSVSPGLRAFRIVTITGTILGAGAGIGGYFLHEKYYNDYNNVKKDDSDENKIGEYRNFSFLGEGLRNGGIGVAGVCFPAFTISLFF